jgi:signal transduction histidine kinase
VFLCDDVAEARELTRAGVEEDPSLRVVGEAADGVSAVPGIAESGADVVLLDLSMPGGGGLEAIPRIRERIPRVRIVVFSGRAGGPELTRGADGYVRKGEPFEEVRRAIHDAGDGRGTGALAHPPKRSSVDLDQFTAVVSHDLEEPLRVISGFARLLSRRYEGRLDERADKYLQAIARGGERMQAMLGALLAYSQVSQSDATPALVNCRELVQDVAEGLAGQIAESRAAVAIGELPVVAGEPDLLAELFQNLLSNAIKFRAERPPEIRVDAERVDGEWRFSVADNGLGIETREATRVFDMFRRAPGRDRPGTGVGLAICDRIVERHGGRIWVDPRPEGGSVFRFTLPDPANPSAPPR